MKITYCAIRTDFWELLKIPQKPTLRNVKISLVFLWPDLSKSKIYKLTHLKLIPMGNNPHIRQKFFDKDTIDAWLLGEPDLSDETLEHRFNEQLMKNIR